MIVFLRFIWWFYYIRIKKARSELLMILLHPNRKRRESREQCHTWTMMHWETDKTLKRSVHHVPLIIVSNLTVTLCPNKKDFTRFEIASSQKLMLLTHSQELCMEFLISERGEEHWYQDFPCKCRRTPLCHNIKNTFTPLKHKECVIVSESVCVCDCLKSEQPPSASAYGRG
jgi:hypothetical protein